METARTRKGLILALTCAAQFMVVLDIAIVNVALPAIQQDLDMRQNALQWVVIAYGLLLGGFLLLGGRLGDLLGRRRIFLAGLTLFSAASLLAGLAGSADLLIAARALQGFGAALVAPSALSILAVTFTEGRERNWALGIFGAVGGSSASVGVIASGLLTDGPGWRWIFFINLPVGVLLILLAARFLAADRPAAGSRHFDALGAATVTAGLLLLRLRAQPRGRRRLDVGDDDRHLRRRGGAPGGVRAGRGPVTVAARTGRRPAQPDDGGGRPGGVPPVRRVLLLHLPRVAADAAAPPLLAHANRRRMAGDVGDGVPRRRHHRRPAGVVVRRASGS